jgi:hypothetical protein
VRPIHQSEPARSDRRWSWLLPFCPWPPAGVRIRRVACGCAPAGACVVASSCREGRARIRQAFGSCDAAPRHPHGRSGARRDARTAPPATAALTAGPARRTGACPATCRRPCTPQPARSPSTQPRRGAGARRSASPRARSAHRLACLREPAWRSPPRTGLTLPPIPLACRGERSPTPKAAVQRGAAARDPGRESASRQQACNPTPHCAPCPEIVNSYCGSRHLTVERPSSVAGGWKTCHVPRLYVARQQDRRVPGGARCVRACTSTGSVPVS